METIQTVIKSQGNNTDLIRYDQEQAFNAYTLCKTFHEDAHAIVDVITYFAMKYQKSICEYYFSNATYQKDIELESMIRGGLKGYYKTRYPEKNDEEINSLVDKDKIIYFGYDDFSNELNIPRSRIKAEHLKPQYLIDEFGDNFIEELTIINIYNKKDKLDELLKYIRTKNYIPEEKLQQMLKVTRNGNIRTDKIADAARREIIKKYKSKYPSKIHYDNWLDNSIYRLAFEKIKMRFETKNTKRSEITSMLAGIDVVKFVTKHVVKGKTNRDKVTFAVVLSDFFVQNLNNFFCVIDVNKSRELHLKKSRLLHDYIISHALVLRNKPGKVPLDFDKLCVICGAENFNKPKDKETAFPRQKAYINEKFKEFIEITGYPIRLVWEKRNENSNYPNQPILEFDKPYYEFANIYDKLLKDKLDEELITFYLSKHRSGSLNVINYISWLETYQNNPNTYYEINSIFNKAAKSISDHSISTKETEKFIGNYIVTFKRNLKVNKMAG